MASMNSRSRSSSIMAKGQTNSFAEQLLQFARPDATVTTDGQLLASFVNGCDETALTAIIHRHAQMVWGVCRRLLPRSQDAEDAFQATFLVLVRKVACIRDREALANWIYGVARQTAIRLRS